MHKISELLEQISLWQVTVEHGKGLGHKKFFPTTKPGPAETEADAAERCLCDKCQNLATQSMQGITNVGYKPTVGERFPGC